MKYFAYSYLTLAWLLLSGCWTNPSIVKIESDPPGARVFFNEQDLGVTPISTVLACTSEAQYVRLEFVDQPTQNIPLYKKPIRYYVPWYAVVAFGIVSFQTTWRSEACSPETLNVKMVNETAQKAVSTSPVGGETQTVNVPKPISTTPVQSDTPVSQVN